jgi:L-lactate dehydrogenase complex protein LldF
MSDPRNELTQEIRSDLKNKAASQKLWTAMERGRANRAATIQSLGLDLEEFKEASRSIKLDASASRAALVDQFINKIRANGGEVFVARKGDEAIEYIAKVCKRAEATTLVKTKSLTSEEIELNHGLERLGIKAIETDLGELVCQVAGEKPSHLVFPAIHKSAKDIADLFSKEYGEQISEDPSDILSHIRAHLRSVFLGAKVGVTGANVGIAESGTIIIETNEGNGRLVTSIPKIHVVIIGMEKIVAKWSDAPALIQAHPISATGQLLTVYVSMISSHVPLAGQSEGREYHVIILDNGRTKMQEDPWFSDALNCIRCGACMNICPTYGIVGGHTFGYIYPGPIGIPWTANVHGVDKAAFANLCISCGLCKEICPVDIDMPLMISKVKEKEIKEDGQLTVNSFFASSDRLARFASATAPVSNWLMRTRTSRYLLEKTFGVDRRRSLPSFQRKRLRSRVAEMNLPRNPGAKKIVFFPDLYADYNDPELGVRAVALIEELGYAVEIPERLKWSGMPYISYGEIEKATMIAAQNLEVLSQFVDEGCEIVSTEPTAVYMMREVYPKLIQNYDGPIQKLGGDAAKAKLLSTALKVEKVSKSFFEFIERDLPDARLTRSYENAEIGFHIPCHERALSSGKPAISFLERAGYTVNVVETGTCCGMAGTFGMKHGPLGYDLSMAVGEKLFERFRESGYKIIATESSVCSTQLTDGLQDVKVLHPLHMIQK